MIGGTDPRPASLVRREWMLICLAVGASAWLSFLCLGSYPLVDGDAAFYGRLARNAAERGQWLSPHFTEDPRGFQLDKPPLPIWAMALSFAAAGAGELPARAWHAACAVAIVAMLAWSARRRLGALAGADAGLVLATSGAVFYLSREPLYDVPLTLFVSAAILCGDAYARDGRFPQFLLACLALGLGVLTKGPVALVLPIGTLALAAWWNGLPLRRYVPSSWPRAAAGLLLVALVALPWHVAVFYREGGAFASRFLGTTGVGRYLIADRMPGMAVPMYAGLLLLGCLPWSGIVATAAIGAARARGRDAADTAGTPRLALAWMAMPVLFFGLSPGPVFLRYVLPSLPGAALLVAWWIAQPVPPGRRTAAVLQMAGGLALCGASLVVSRAVPAAAGPLAGQATAAVGAVAIASGAWLWAGRQRRALALSALATLLVYSWLALRAPAVVERLWPERGVARVVNAAAGPAACVSTYRAPTGPFLMLSFYLNSPPTPAVTARDLRTFLGRTCSHWVIESPGERLPSDIQSTLTLTWRHAAGIGVWHDAGARRTP